jgi:hypothetical protein
MLKKQKDDQFSLINDLSNLGGNSQVIKELRKDITVSLHKEIVEEGTKKLTRTQAALNNELQGVFGAPNRPRRQATAVQENG